MNIQDLNILETIKEDASLTGTIMTEAFGSFHHRKPRIKGGKAYVTIKHCKVWIDGFYTIGGTIRVFTEGSNQ